MVIGLTSLIRTFKIIYNCTVTVVGEIIFHVRPLRPIFALISQPDLSSLQVVQRRITATASTMKLPVLQGTVSPSASPRPGAPRSTVTM